MSARTWATVADLAEQYQVSERNVRQKVKDGAWPADRVGRLIRFSPEQQDQIAHLVRCGWTSTHQRDRISAALAQLTA